MHVIVKLKLPTGETLTSAEKIWRRRRWACR